MRKVNEDNNLQDLQKKAVRAVTEFGTALKKAKKDQWATRVLGFVSNISGMKV